MNMTKKGIIREDDRRFPFKKWRFQDRDRVWRENAIF